MSPSYDGISLSRDLWGEAKGAAGAPRSALGGALSGTLWGGVSGFAAGAMVGQPMAGAAIGATIGLTVGALKGLADMLKKITGIFDRLAKKSQDLAERYKNVNATFARTHNAWQMLNKNIDRAWASTIEPIFKQLSVAAMDMKKSWVELKMQIFKVLEPVLKWLIEKMKAWGDALLKITGNLVDFGRHLVAIVASQVHFHTQMAKLTAQVFSTKGMALGAAMGPRAFILDIAKDIVRIIKESKDIYKEIEKNTRKSTISMPKHEPGIPTHLFKDGQYLPMKLSRPPPSVSMTPFPALPQPTQSSLGGPGAFGIASTAGLFKQLGLMSMTTFRPQIPDEAINKVRASWQGLSEEDLTRRGQKDFAWTETPLPKEERSSHTLIEEGFEPLGEKIKNFMKNLGAAMAVTSGVAGDGEEKEIVQVEEEEEEEGKKKTKRLAQLESKGRSLVNIEVADSSELAQTFELAWLEIRRKIRKLEADAKFRSLMIQEAGGYT